MIFMKTKEGHPVLILEPGNLKFLKEGGIVKSPDEPSSVIVMYTPDIMKITELLKDKVAKEGGFEAEYLHKILQENKDLPEVFERPYHHTDWVRNIKK